MGISGSIAAYKSVLLLRLLVKEGAEVKVLMTDAAKDFISPLTFSTLSKNPVYSSFIQDNNGIWTNHVELGLWADIFIIAPASANTLSKCANGICDNLLIATYLSAKCPVFFAPAMDLDMYVHPSTLNNLAKLTSYGNHIIQAGYGELASGLIGEGRLAEPEEITQKIIHFFVQEQVFYGKKVLITAGPTQEPLDPVRFISNHSSGKMGYAIAEAFVKSGAMVRLISGPVSLPPPVGLVLENVQTAQEMYDATLKNFTENDIIIFSAAVADYTPKVVADKKIKKNEEIFMLELSKTTDIAASIGQIKKENQIVVGFALETDNELKNAQEKMKRKNFDYIVLNSLQESGAGFRYDTNKVKIISRNGKIHDFELKSKKEVAVDLLEIISNHK